MGYSGSVNAVNDYYECVVEVLDGCVAAQSSDVETAVSKVIIMLKVLGVTADIHVMYDGPGNDNRHWRYFLQDGEAF